MAGKWVKPIYKKKKRMSDPSAITLIRHAGQSNNQSRGRSNNPYNLRLTIKAGETDHEEYIQEKGSSKNSHSVQQQGMVNIKAPNLSNWQDNKS